MLRWQNGSFSCPVYKITFYVSEKYISKNSLLFGLLYNSSVVKCRKNRKRRANHFRKSKRVSSPDFGPILA